MIRFTYDDDEGKTYLGLGVSRENINRLTNGQPIRVQMADVGGKVDGALMIFFAETDVALQQTVAEFIGPDTKVHIDPRLKSKLT